MICKERTTCPISVTTIRYNIIIIIYMFFESPCRRAVRVPTFKSATVRIRWHMRDNKLYYVYC